MMNWITLKLKNLAGNLKSVFAHFPLACMFSLAFSILFSFWMLNEIIYDCEFSFIGVPFYTLLWGSGTAMILTFSADLFCYLREKLGWQRLVCNAVAVLLAAISAWIIYRQAESDFIVYYVFAMLFAVLLTMLSWPLLGKRCPEMLWNYHTRLFLTLAASTCLSMIAFAGIALVQQGMRKAMQMEKATQRALSKFIPNKNWMLNSTKAMPAKAIIERHVEAAKVKKSRVW